MKKILSLLLAAAVVFSFMVPIPGFSSVSSSVSSSFSSCASAAEDSIAVAVIGADLTDDQVRQVYEVFGFSRGSVTELRMTNELERKYLEGAVDVSVIGTRSVSCVYVERLPAGSGLQVTTTNTITYFTPEMYISALTTAGITDGRIIAAAPFEVSGTGALAGIYYAYEYLTGQTIDELQKNVSAQELTVTGDLAEVIGDADASDIVSDVKTMLSTVDSMTDDQLRELILGVAYQYNVSLTDGQVSQMIRLCRSIASLDEAGLLDKVTSVQETIDKVSGAAGGLLSFFRTVKNIVSSVWEFFGKIKAALN